MYSEVLGVFLDFSLSGLDSGDCERTLIYWFVPRLKAPVRWGRWICFLNLHYGALQ